MVENCLSTELFSGEGIHQGDNGAIRGNSNATLKMLEGELILLLLMSCNIATPDLCCETLEYEVRGLCTIHSY